MNGGPKPKILISDDEPESVAVWGRRGRQFGFEVIPDTSSRVVELAREHRPALILLDLNQSVPGLELLHLLKRDPQTRDIPVMVVSGTDEGWVQAAAQEFGAVEFVPKPVDDAVVARVADFARAHAGDRNPGQPPPTAWP